MIVITAMSGASIVSVTASQSQCQTKLSVRCAQQIVRSVKGQGKVKLVIGNCTGRSYLIDWRLYFYYFNAMMILWSLYKYSTYNTVHRANHKTVFTEAMISHKI